jgi:hypothetical protein
VDQAVEGVTCALPRVRSALLLGRSEAALAQPATPADPVDAIVAAFDERSLVGLAEAHGLQEGTTIVDFPDF